MNFGMYCKCEWRSDLRYQSFQMCQHLLLKWSVCHELLLSHLDAFCAQHIFPLHDGAVVTGVGGELLVQPVHVLSCLLEISNIFFTIFPKNGMSRLTLLWRRKENCQSLAGIISVWSVWPPETEVWTWLWRINISYTYRCFWYPETESVGLGRKVHDSNTT